jgi:hypothetical protein
MPGADEQLLTRLQARTVATGESAKWMVAALGGIGALLLTGLQLAKVSGVDGVDRHAALLLGSALGVAGLILAGLVTVRVLLQSSVSLEDLAAREAGERPDRYRLLPWITESRATVLPGYDSVSELVADYRKSFDEAARTLAEHYADPLDPDKAIAAQEADERALTVNGVTAELVAHARCRETQRTFTLARRWLAGIGPLVALGILAVTWALNAPARPPVDLRGAELTSGTLVNAELVKAKLDGLKISGMDLRGTNLGEASIEKTTWTDTRCPDGVRSDNAGDTCAGHLEP